MYKKISKGKNDTWDDVARRVYGTPARAGDIAKMNNSLSSGEVLAADDNDNSTADTTGEVYLETGDNKYTDFSEYTLFDRLGAVKGAAFIFNLTDAAYDFSFNNEVKVYNENELFLSGRVANIKQILDNTLNWAQVEVKSDAGILAETNIAYPLEFTNVSIKEILEQVAGWYNQKITFSDESDLNEIFTNEIGTSFTADINETAWGFMQRICSSRGFLMTDTGNGLFIGRYKAETQEKINLIDGEALGVKKIKGVFNTVGLARYYELNSQYPSTDTAVISTPLPIPVTKRVNSNDFNSLDLQSAAQRIACREIGQHFKIEVEISENLNVKSGDFAIVKNPKIGIDTETDFVIENVERRHPDVTFLELTLPCAYTYEMPETLPLC